MFRNSLIAGTVLLASALPGHAAIYDWSYVFDGGTQTLAGVIDGNPLGVGSQIIGIDAIFDVTLNGAAFGAPLSAVNNAQWWYGGVGDALAALDGTNIDFCAAEVGPCVSNGFLFDVGVSSQNFALFPNEDRTDNYPGFGPFDAYDSAGWSMVARTAEVPLPAALGLMLAALGTLAGLRGRRRA